MASRRGVGRRSDGPVSPNMLANCQFMVWREASLETALHLGRRGVVVNRWHAARFIARYQ